MDDERIITLIRDGHRRAFEELIKRYQKQIHFLALRFMNNWEDADEITQTAFIRLYLFILKSKGDILVLPWLKRVVTNICLDQKKSKKWRLFFKNVVRSDNTNNPDDIKRDPLDAISDTRLSPENILLNKELGNNLNKSLKNLSDQQRQIFIMKHYEGLKIKDIAQELDISEGQIKSQLFRAIRTLRKGLGEFYEGQDKASQ